jgi:hypothetical protein
LGYKINRGTVDNKSRISTKLHIMYRKFEPIPLLPFIECRA